MFFDDLVLVLSLKPTGFAVTGVTMTPHRSGDRRLPRQIEAAER